MKLSHIFLSALIGAVVAIGALQFFPALSGAPAAQKESAFERVMRTNTLRCGYLTWAPFLLIDPQTKEKSGIAYDFMQAVAEELNIKVEWVEEIGWGNFHEGLNSGRYDAMCVPVWESGARARIALLSKPLYDTGLYAYAREDDARFDASFESVNSKDVRVAVIDGDITQAIRRTKFPQAQELALPQMADPGQFLLSVVTRKADISLDNPFEVDRYNQHAEIKLKPIAGGMPMVLFGNSYAVKLGETDFKMALDSVVDTLLRNGKAESIIKKYKGFQMPRGS